MKNGLVLFVLLLFANQLIAQAPESYIQVNAEPGIQIFLDGRFKGITNEDTGGLIITGLTGGTYRIRAVKEGYQPQEASMTLSDGQVKEFNVSPFKPRISIEETGDTEGQTLQMETGNLKIQSLPISIGISIERVGIEYDKKQDEWTARNIPPGVYTAVFTWNQKSLREDIEIVGDETTHIFVDLINMKIEYRNRPGKYGGVMVTSKPNGILYIDERNYGETPVEIQSIRTGKYKASVLIELDKSTYFDNQITLESEFEIFNKRKTRLDFDLSNEYSFGTLSVISNDQDVFFAIISPVELNKKPASNASESVYYDITSYYDSYNSVNTGFKYTLKTDFSSKIRSGEYSLKSPYENMYHEFSIYKDRTTEIQITPPIPLKRTLPLKTIYNIDDHQSFSDYYRSIYTPLPEEKTIETINYNWRCGEIGSRANTTWGTTWTIAHYVVGAVGWGLLIYNGGAIPAEEAKYGLGLSLVGAGAVMRHLIAPLHSKTKTVRDETHIMKNNQMKEYYLNQYDEKLNQWETQLSEINEQIKRENEKIQEENEQIKLINESKKTVSITYK